MHSSAPRRSRPSLSSCAISVSPSAVVADVEETGRDGGLFPGNSEKIARAGAVDP
jgi:hypothetical protein